MNKILEQKYIKSHLILERFWRSKRCHWLAWIARMWLLREHRSQEVANQTWRAMSLRDRALLSLRLERELTRKPHTSTRQARIEAGMKILFTSHKYDFAFRSWVNFTQYCLPTQRKGMSLGKMLRGEYAYNKPLINQKFSDAAISYRPDGCI
jgi:hypothetical protein